MCEALVNIGVFNDDRVAFDFGVTMWRGRAPAYIYLKSDGPKPIEPIGCGPAIWGNKGLTPGASRRPAAGIRPRPRHHARLRPRRHGRRRRNRAPAGHRPLLRDGPRIIAALEFQAQYLPPNNTPPPANLEFAVRPTWEIAFNEFHNRLGKELPKMAAVLPTIRPTGINHHIPWETLTHGDIGAIGLPPVAAPQK